MKIMKLPVSRHHSFPVSKKYLENEHAIRSDLDYPRLGSQLDKGNNKKVEDDVIFHFVTINYWLIIT